MENTSARLNAFRETYLSLLEQNRQQNNTTSTEQGVPVQPESPSPRTVTILDYVDNVIRNRVLETRDVSNFCNEE